MLSSPINLFAWISIRRRQRRLRLNYACYTKIAIGFSQNRTF